VPERAPFDMMDKFY
jgi:heat shock protein beta